MEWQESLKQKSFDEVEKPLCLFKKKYIDGRI